MEIVMALLLILATSFLIWKSGEGFEAAADYLGRNLSNGVKGATINAIGSSLPELLTTFFFLFILKNSEGFAGGLGTTAGSAVFNAVVIPFIVGVAVFFKFRKKEFSFSKKVILRDGIALIAVNVLLLVMIKSGDDSMTLTWKEGLYLMLFYLAYLAYLFMSMDKKDLEVAKGESKLEEIVAGRKKREIFGQILRLDFTGAFVGNGEINTTRAWLLLIFSMTIMSISCYGLAEGSIFLGEELGIPIYIVSVILAAAATSVPDTYLSYKDASKGNYDDSLSNAFGSNVFDIGFAVGFPVLIFGLFYGDINMSSSVEKDISELLMLLLIITVIVFLIFISSSKLSLKKLIVLLFLYFGFVAIVLSKAMNFELIDNLSSFLYNLSEFFKL